MQPLVNAGKSDFTAPPTDSVEAWALTLIQTRRVAGKLDPPAPPNSWEQDPPARRIAAPGRPAAWRVVQRSPRSPRAGALVNPAKRARLLHTFLHHELQAAELCCWALLAFPDSPKEFRKGLLGIVQDELRHARLYRSHLAGLGCAPGDHPVRDWFWERVPACGSALEFVALLGMGFEAANLDHSRSFAARLRSAGDEAGALLQERIGREEEAHVRFALRWFERWTGGQDFDRWRELLPAPLTPLILRGKALDTQARERAGQSVGFLRGLAAFGAGGGPAS